MNNLNLTFSTENECSNHKETVQVTKEVEKPKCVMCEIAFSTIEQIQQRILEEHMHGCETCGNKFKAKTLLKEHISVTNHLQKAHSVSCEL